MAKAKLVTRTSTTSSVTEDNLNKASALSHAELDSNLINLRDSGFGIADDTSTVLAVTNDKTITIEGAGTVSTSISGDTLTITGAAEAQSVFQTIAVAGQSNVVADSTTDTLTLTAGSNITITTDADTDTITIAGTDTNTTYGISAETATGGVNLRLTGSDAGTDDVKLAEGTNITLTRTDANTITVASTASGGDLVDDTTPQLGGSLDVNGNKIVSVSNGNIVVEPNGTGLVRLGTDSIDNIKLANWFMTTGATSRGAVRTYERSVDLSTLDTSADRIYANHDLTAVTLTGSGDGNNSERIRQQRALQLDTAGFNTPYTHGQYQSIANIDVTEITNSAAGASTLAEAMGLAGAVAIGAGSINAGDITVTKAIAMSAYVSVGANTRTTTTVTSAYGQLTGMVDSSGGGGTKSIGTYYGVYVANQGKTQITTPYALYVEDDDYLSKIGKIEAYKEKINALTSDTTITTNCALAPVHTVTLAGNTEFVITNLGTGQTVTLIITQDGTGSRTATFGTDGSTAVKFPGGAPTLSTAASAIDVVTIFNDGTNYLGNIAQAYA